MICISADFDIVCALSIYHYLYLLTSIFSFNALVFQSFKVSYCWTTGEASFMQILLCHISSTALHVVSQTCTGICVRSYHWFFLFHVIKEFFLVTEFIRSIKDVV